MNELPSGTVTFLWTDIEDSSGRWESSPEEMRVALAAHDALISEVVDHHGGLVVTHLGDGCWAAFDSAPQAVDAAIGFQRQHQLAASRSSFPLRVRIGLHTGDVDPVDGDYFGPVVNRSARVADLANGDQIVCSAATAGLLHDVELRKEGIHELLGIGREEMYVVLADGIATDPAPLRHPIKPTNVPRILNSFLGRDEDVALVTTLIEAGDPLVTLVGPGGVGKTRLAIELGSRMSDAFDQRVYFCDLVPVADGDAGSVAEAVAEVVGARLQPGMGLVESVADFLSARPSLVILDNCEHVLEAVRAMVDSLVQVDGVHVLATSREALRLEVERQLLVEPLLTATDGVALFLDRARRRDPRFDLTEENEPAVVELVHHLDGLTADPTDPQSFCRAALASVAMNNTHDADAADAVTSAWLAAGPSTVGGRVWALQAAS